MADMNGTVMEISGLGQEPADGKPYGWILAALGLGAVACMIITPLLMKKRGAEGLGILKKCAPGDKVSWKKTKDQAWCLFDSKGKRVIGRHSSRSKALRQERLINMKKRAR